MTDINRLKENFDKGWKFHLGDLPIMHAVKGGMTGGLTDCEDIEDGEWLKIAYFDERESSQIDPAAWKEVVLPHDWCVEGDYLNDGGKVKHHKSHGYLAAGVGCYRKVFDIPQELEGKKISLEFDGVFRNSTVWVNGHLLGIHASGYTGFTYDISDIARYGSEGKNVVFVKVDARDYEGWWYEGAGIYRHTWLTVTDRLHVERYGTYVTTPEVSEEQAGIAIVTTVRNEYDAAKACRLVTKIYDIHGKIVGESASSMEISFQQQGVFEHFVRIDKPALWSPESPSLYYVMSEVYDEDQLRDTYRTIFGIRTIEFKADAGFFLNGKHYPIKGTCNHQDFAGVGVALPDQLIAYKLRLLKEMGCNAYRSAHHPATPELLDLCDQMGMLVVDENRKLDVSPSGIEELKHLLYRDRNHPSVIIWSLENEEILEGTIMGARMVKTLASITRSIDPTRPTLAAMNHGWNDGGYSDGVDIVGYNYGQREDQDIRDHEKYPNRIMLGSESASCTVTRGIYERDDIQGYCPEYGIHIPEWSCSVEKAWRDVVENPFLSGVFIWTGFDYRGEPTPYEWPNINSHFGVMDTCGFPKDNYYYLKSAWTDEPMVHIMPHWNWPGREGQIIDVWVYSNCERIELFLNGKSLGEQEMPRASHLEWKVSYEPGELTAIGRNGSTEAARKVAATTDAPYAVKLVPDRTQIQADGCDVAVMRAYVVDAHGRVVPTVDNELHFSMEGNANILGVGNGNPSSHEPDKANQRKAFNGSCLLIIQSLEEAGEIVIKSTSHGLIDSVCTITSF
ncbi:beta-galactosidase GalA [Paenibacillus aceris]|uniref:Beta-galactosidase n=1 Tax=Paenibacillus aceris TaxID=869555 RepID=A0ABS4I3E1_9BACL|nr:beta-galactosidase GalA [Paenibacillus aceris]MBP1965318.1 beta-galactosidase [Paenibacillus aceris]NHW35999.1 glycoside hydrolase family 2 protein [Paenibacillus aceris]